MDPRRRPERAWIGATVLLCHLVGLWAWRPDLPASRGAPARLPTPLTVQLRPPAAPPAAARDAVAPRPGPQRAAGAARPRPAAPAAIEVPVAVPAQPDTPSAHVAAPEAAASAAPLDLRLRLPRGSVAERGGLTEPLDSMRRAALNDPRSNVVTDPTQVLPRAVASSAKGDCLKGEYAGGGMGLLSLPFLALAVARDACKPSR
jgi:hypothetical protein